VKFWAIVHIIDKFIFINNINQINHFS